MKEGPVGRNAQDHRKMTSGALSDEEGVKKKRRMVNAFP